MQKIIDFRRDLALYGTVPPSGKPIGRFLLTQWEPAFIDGVFILLLQLRTHDAIRSDPTVAADAELFLINRPFDRTADETVGIRIIIQIADTGASVPVRLHIRLHRTKYRLLLLGGEQIFHFISLKNRLDRHSVERCFRSAKASFPVKYRQGFRNSHRKRRKHHGFKRQYKPTHTSTPSFHNQV